MMHKYVLAMINDLKRAFSIGVSASGPGICTPDCISIDLLMFFPLLASRECLWICYTVTYCDHTGGWEASRHTTDMKGCILFILFLVIVQSILVYYLLIIYTVTILQVIIQLKEPF